MENILRGFGNVYVTLLLFGSFLILVPPTILGVPFQLFSVPLRYFLLFVSLYYILEGILKGKYVNRNIIFLYALFWMFYVIRVVIDVEIRRVPHFVFETSRGYYQAIVYCFFTSFSLFFINALSYEKVLRYCYLVLLVSCIATLSINLGASAEKIQSAQGRLEGTDGMSSIEYGHFGVSLSLLSIIYIFKGGGLKNNRIIYIGSLCLGLFVMFLAGSRSPFLALLICLLVFQIYNQGALKGAFFLFLFSLPFVLYFDSIMLYLDQYGSNFILRLTSAMEGDRGGRDSLFSTGLEQFISSPFWGDSFLISNGFGLGIYPHNLLLESFMALGFMGGTIFLYFIIKGLKMMYGLLKANRTEMWVGLIFLQQLVLSMFSMSIYTHVKFWVILALLLNIMGRLNLKKKFY